MDGVVNFDSAHFREVLGQYPTGVCVITSVQPDGTPVGMSVGTFSSVSLDPPLVAFLPDQRSQSWGKIRAVGTFCVNVLGAEQEPVCRVFASKAEDKFAGLTWSTSPKGLPILDGSVAWIDCELDVTHDAGDHHIVIGRVTDLEIARPGLPLLFYRGGYGQFTPLTFAAADEDLLDRLAQVDAVRPAMEALAADVGVDVMASLRRGDTCVYVARAGGRGDSVTSTHVGRRLPFRPPVGGTLLAWSSRAEQDAWITRAGISSGWTKERGYVTLDRIRERGYAIGFGRDEYDDLWANMVAAGRGVSDAQIGAKVDELNRGWAQGPIERDREYQLAILTAPIFQSDGVPVMQFNLLGFPTPLTGARIDYLGKRLLAATAAASAAIQRTQKGVLV